MTNPTLLRDAANRQMSLVDQIRLSLQQRGKQNIYFNLGDEATRLGMRPGQYYQALHRIEQGGEVKVITEPEKGTGRKRIVGVHLNKLTPPTEILNRAIAAPIDTTRLVKKTISKVQDQVPNLMAYRTKKDLLDRIRGELVEAGFNPEEVLQLPATDAIAEEGLFCYEAMCAAQRHAAELETQMELLRRVPVQVSEVTSEGLTPVMA